jgi:O-methyltransferase
MDLRPVFEQPSNAARYLALLKACLTRELFFDEEVAEVVSWPPGTELGDPDELWAKLDRLGWKIVRPMNRRANARERGKDTPPHAETMVGRKRLNNLQWLIERALRDAVPGDLVEAGVWRGGAAILMRAVLVARNDESRRVWVCDSFAGLPEPDTDRFPIDESLRLDPDSSDNLMRGTLAVSVDTVKANFAHYGLLDDRVCFVEGWFKDTLPTAPIDEVAVLRVDGDLYESTMDVLTNLEDRVSPGGYVIIDDYHGLEACRQAVDDYRADRRIDAPLTQIDWTGVWWQKPAE